jgi:predicted MPP superfamily phosphohydrolase
MTGLRIALLIGIAAAILFGLHYYVWARLVRDPQLPSPWGGIATAALALMAVLLVAGMASSRALPRSMSSPLLWVGFTWLGLAFFLVVLLGAVDLVRVVISATRRVLDAGVADPERRVLLGRLVGGAVSVIAIGLGGVGLANVVRAVGIKRVRIPLARLPTNRTGYTIVQLSDVHVGPTIGRGFIEDLVARTNALSPDLIAITGDLVDGSVDELREHVAPLAKLRARDGVFFVTGNHEYYSGVDAWLAHLETLGVRVLRNEHVAVDAGFDLAGVDDWTAHQFGGDHGADLPRALSGRDTTRALVLLAHQPKAIVEAAAMGVGLQLSGHTHGGQLFPFNYLVKLQQPYVAGLHTHGGTQIYVSQGTGYWGPPMRLGTSAEITRIELVPA